MKNEKCCLCGDEIIGYGNNPAPVADEGQCCDLCNITKVIPARLKQFRFDEEEKRYTDPTEDDLNEGFEEASTRKPKVGDKIRIINMEGEMEYAGREGTIEAIDGIGQLHGTWGGLAIAPEFDTIEILN